MTQEEIIKGNKLIAEFMGLFEVTKEYWINAGFKGRYGKGWFINPVSGEGKNRQELKYHSSWDCLMPVWVKCKEIGLWMMTNGYDKLWLEKSKEIESAIALECDCKKAASYISQLIKWYNKEKDWEGLIHIDDPLPEGPVKL